MRWKRREIFGTWWRGDISFWLQTEDAISPHFPFKSPHPPCAFGSLAGLSSRFLLAQIVHPRWGHSSHLLSASPPDHTPPWSQLWHTHLTFTLTAQQGTDRWHHYSFLPVRACVYTCETIWQTCSNPDHQVNTNTGKYCYIIKTQTQILTFKKKNIH